MSPAEYFIDNRGVKIHALEFNSEDDRTPLVMVPGMINSADEVADAIQHHLSRRTIIISIRGRGKSDSPSEGWNLDAQASDVAAVVRYFDYADVFLFGHSVGGPIAARSIPLLSARTLAIMIGDYAPVYPPFEENWRKKITEIDGRQISDKALVGLTKNPERTLVTQYLESLGSSVFFLKSELDDSLLQPGHLTRLSTLLPQAQIKVLKNCGHEFLSDDPKQSMDMIEDIISNVS